VLKLTELNESEYSYDIAKDETERKADKHIKYLIKSASDIKNIGIKLDNIIELYSGSSNTEEVYEMLTDIIGDSARATNRLRKLVKDTGIKGVEVFSQIELDGRVEDGILHIVSPVHPPKRVAVTDKSYYDEIRYVYYCAFKEFFKKIQYEIANEKAILAFYFNYTSGRELTDHDNFELKCIIDILTTYVLPDDSPKWCAHFCDYRMGERESTDIYIIPESKYIDFLVKKQFI